MKHKNAFINKTDDVSVKSILTEREFMMNNVKHPPKYTYIGDNVDCSALWAYKHSATAIGFRLYQYINNTHNLFLCIGIFHYTLLPIIGPS